MSLARSDARRLPLADGSVHVTTTTIHRPALRYFGGKWELAPWIISHFPANTCYVEPFGGAMSVMLRKPPSYIDVYNDADGEVVNFFHVLRNRPKALIRAIRLTPVARAELDLAFQHSDDELERARRLFVRSWQCIGGPRTQWRAGWRFNRTKARGARSLDDWQNNSHLEAVAQRLLNIYLEHDDALAILARFDAPDTLFYCDPPYPAASRSLRWSTHAYQHEMTDADHERLAEVLHGLQGMAIISSYPGDLYDSLYADWPMRHHTARTNGMNKRGKATERIWLSPNIAARQPRLMQ